MIEMENDQIKNEDEYRQLKVTPEMEKYLRDITEGREKLIGPFKDGEDVIRYIRGNDLRKKYY